jgi:uncharacterized protein (DUF1697 family)
MPERNAFVALLRGINVGGHNKLPMKELVAIFERAGCVDVRHYIQSGNVVFAAKQDIGRRIASLVAKDIAREHGFEAPVVVRTAAEIRAIATSNPFLLARGGVDPKALHVMFLADEPSRDRASTLDPDRSRPDAFVLRGREVYLSLPNGAGRTKLTNAYFDSALRTTSTGRNWNTVLELARMSGEAASQGPPVQR